MGRASNTIYKIDSLAYFADQELTIPYSQYLRVI
jgi:hypothetical protein